MMHNNNNVFSLLCLGSISVDLGLLRTTSPNFPYTGSQQLKLQPIYCIFINSIPSSISKYLHRTSMALGEVRSLEIILHLLFVWGILGVHITIVISSWKQDKDLNGSRTAFFKTHQLITTFATTNSPYEPVSSRPEMLSFQWVMGQLFSIQYLTLSVQCCNQHLFFKWLFLKCVTINIQ